VSSVTRLVWLKKCTWLFILQPMLLWSLL
jgi:hypothetical protein